ncbi:monooxygenase [Frankia sp. CNm7]|uniref:FAD-dependent oxidoreductase n=1 Tax=Frankia nepalensis TaxID=1836974 RepID=A0A937UTQ4_9ACTN|nr:FAD-dependent oxidoreductase [Frankia nepalensis]MBL7500635.1 monooxygenase [Frankia nepalensis]MBL7511404.1 monooxygenase [Frankia nepalensis]MBL7521763.1 monooxygenase [Frankia nepalensis]MBL7631500.1 FAD-dependent oxidoreductase [Frankia nepalensis]
MPQSPARLDTVVVVGGSVAGLLAAAAASPSADRVVVLDRDQMPSGPEPRPGTPQARHSHGLLAGGRLAVETLLPGFTAQMIEAGALSGADTGRSGRWWVGGDLIAGCDLGAEGLAASRPLIEHMMRERIRDLPNVELLGEVDVTGLCADGGRVTGVHTRARNGDDAPRLFAADLVVDASGRSGRAARWLPAVGASAPAEERINVGVRYVTTHVKILDADLVGWGLVVSGATPTVPRGGIAIMQEDLTWSLTLFGYGDEPIPVDPDGMRRFAAGLVGPELATLLADREPLGVPLTYRFPDARRRRFELLADLPLGYAPVGDAICSLDPTFGQGMSVAALEAAALAEELAGGLAAVRDAYPRRAARIVDGAWTLVQGTVSRLPGAEGDVRRGDTPVGRYVRRLQRVAARDPEVARAFLRVTNLLAPPASLLAPAVARRVLRPGAARA